MSIKSASIASLVAGMLMAAVVANAATDVAIPQGARLKDIATVKGVRENILIGYGLVVGLKGTGDSSADVTAKSLGRLFGKLGLDVEKMLRLNPRTQRLLSLLLVCRRLRAVEMR